MDSCYAFAPIFAHIVEPKQLFHISMPEPRAMGWASPAHSKFSCSGDSFHEIFLT